jgi:hypothetical protein
MRLVIPGEPDPAKQLDPDALAEVGEEIWAALSSDDAERASLQEAQVIAEAEGRRLINL